jgi:hypothetical protein
MALGPLCQDSHLRLVIVPGQTSGQLKGRKPRACAGKGWLNYPRHQGTDHPDKRPCHTGPIKLENQRTLDAAHTFGGVAPVMGHELAGQRALPALDPARRHRQKGAITSTGT